MLELHGMRHLRARSRQEMNVEAGLTRIQRSNGEGLKPRSRSSNPINSQVKSTHNGVSGTMTRMLVEIIGSAKR